ncbi:nuclease-related domain-containing protein [Peribacillus kribbensis]|uniref:nuclease-related domain-containing protein n=1 Tax=Peribacillus kribbensis TaxID=356658 RepID=UPI0004196FCC|nr:nuclease-related domain-containing protein [Peribacillus kribbensis]
MLLKSRCEPYELMVMRILDTRAGLTNSERFQYLNLERGYEGELKFDALTEILGEEIFIINDLLLKVNNSYFQIDSVFITQGGIHLLDIKNFQGSCYLESDKLYSVTTEREYKNPIDQLKRSAALFRQLLQSHKQNYLVDPSVIFINPEFTLYQTPLDQPIILPTQINQFFTKLNKTASKLNEDHKKLAQTLLSLHQTKNPYTTLPDYQYEQLQMGVYCNRCKSFLVTIHKFDFVCKKCEEHERIEKAILRNVQEFSLLFPEQKITTNSIYEWCKADLNKRTIRRVLKRHYTSLGNTSNTYYE